MIMFYIIYVTQSEIHDPTPDQLMALHNIFTHGVKACAPHLPTTLHNIRYKNLKCTKKHQGH